MNYKKKTTYLLVISLLILIVVYFISIKKTIDLYIENKEISQYLSSEITIEKQLSLKNEEALLKSSILNYSIDSINGGDLLLDISGSLCKKNNTILRDVPIFEDSEQNGYQIRTNKVVVEGGFINLLQLLNDYEKSKIGRVSSASFQSYFDRLKNKNILTLTIYIQNVKTIK